ncbi:MAG: Fur family transcriptional regulator [Candidatus Levyibacteriota bacterium]
MTVAKIHNCKEELQALELRATPARVAILKLLEATKEPIDANKIMEHLEKESIATDPATVFRILHMFMQKGIVIPIQFQEGKARYELASKNDHHHLICEHCGRVEDVEDDIIPSLEKHIQDKHHFVVNRHSLEFFGLCVNCQQ